MNSHRAWRAPVRRLIGACVLVVTGCSLFEPEVPLYLDASATDRRVQLWEVSTPPDPRASSGRSSTSRPAEDSSPGVTSQPATEETAAPGETARVAGPPYHLNTRQIIALIYEKSPLTASSRENMVAAQHALEEFKANLSRFEPFVEASGELSDYPERRHSRGTKGEVVGGVQKETFDGAIIRAEGGMSGERVRFGDVEDDQEAVEEGSGGLVRARVEIPFAGSRKRQDRIISQAFQESTARKAVLNYLSNYRRYVVLALNYYNYTLYYLEYVRSYERRLEHLEALLAHPKVRDSDRARLKSVSGDTKVVIESYRDNYRTYLTLVLQYVGIEPDEAYILEEPSLSRTSRYYERTLTTDGQKAMLAEAYENNPQFRVLEDAIADSELKRAYAISGKFDITAFAQGTQFAWGSETFDDRVGGWEVSSGITFRVNDQRVLTASQMKAEAEIRGFRAQISAEQLNVQQDIATQSNALRSRVESTDQILENIEEAQAEFEERRRKYLERQEPLISIDDVLSALGSQLTAEIRLINNAYYVTNAETQLMSATGEVYRMVGLEMQDDGDGLAEVPEE